MSNTLLKQIILFGFIFLLFVPLIQKEFPFYEEKPLKGVFTLTAKPDSIYKNWFSGEYQLKYEKYFNDSIGFRAFFIRLYNQIEFSLFKNVSTQFTALGKDNVLYQNCYIESYLGNDYIGEHKIISEVKKIEFVQNELLKRGKKLLYIIAPGKASIYPDNFPLSYDTICKKTSNYDTYIKYLKQYKIEYFDVRNYFLQIKQASKYPLFPKNGTHWSGYGVSLVADSLYKRLSALFNKDLAEIEFLTGREESINLDFTDNDMGKALNLFFELSNWKMYYPKIKFHSKMKLKALIIGDSFAQSFFGFGHYFYYIFSQDSKYFYYYETVFWPRIDDADLRNIESYNISDLVNENELILVILTDQNLDKNTFGFFDDLYSLFKNGDSITHEETEKVIKNIKSNEKWFKAILRQAKERKISVDEMLRRNAIFTIKNRKK
ncbi:MAG: hypothetical protein A2X08_14795 [Bacteroidetes bacterium GWA2_32_17]|nr:MAG: hypothetical protein A2X08_14795 [Bacteroidetes bacterium GWA2_32_17]